MFLWNSSVSKSLRQTDRRRRTPLTVEAMEGRLALTGGLAHHAVAAHAAVAHATPTHTPSAAQPSQPAHAVVAHAAPTLTPSATAPANANPTTPTTTSTPSAAVPIQAQVSAQAITPTANVQGGGSTATTATLSSTTASSSDGEVHATDFSYDPTFGTTPSYGYVSPFTPGFFDSPSYPASEGSTWGEGGIPHAYQTGQFEIRPDSYYTPYYGETTPTWGEGGMPYAYQTGQFEVSPGYGDANLFGDPYGSEQPDLSGLGSGDPYDSSQLFFDEDAPYGWD